MVCFGMGWDGWDSRAWGMEWHGTGFDDVFLKKTNVSIEVFFWRLLFSLSFILFFEIQTKSLFETRIV